MCAPHQLPSCRPASCTAPYRGCQALKEMIFLPLVYPELFERFHIAPPRGVLFYGPPGQSAAGGFAERPQGGRWRPTCISALRAAKALAWAACPTRIYRPPVHALTSPPHLLAGTGKTLVARALAAHASRAGKKVSPSSPPSPARACCQHKALRICSILTCSSLSFAEHAPVFILSRLRDCCAQPTPARLVHGEALPS